MMEKFKNDKEAAVILAAKINGTIQETQLNPVIHIGEDVRVKVSHRKVLRCEVNAADYEVSAKGKTPWCSVAFKESGSRVKAVGFGTRPEHYEADFDILAGKVLKLAEQFKGSHERAMKLRHSNSVQKERELSTRTAFVPKLIEAGLAAFEEPGDAPYTIESRKENMKPISLLGMPYEFTSLDANLRVEFTLPYDKAEKVLAFLRDELGSKP